MQSPIQYVKCMGRTIDLSQLSEVLDVFFETSWGQSNHPVVGFHYRNSSCKDLLTFVRPLRQGPHRKHDLELLDPSQSLLTLGEEKYRVLEEGSSYRGEDVIIFDEDGVTLKALTNICKERDQLIETWMKWKQIEPEIYAVIRKYLS